MTRIDLSAAADKPSRKTIDSQWSKKQKAAVGIGAGVLALAAIAGGVYYTLSSQPPSLPTNATEALAVMSSAKFDRLDDMRQLQYAEEAARLLREMPQEERRALMQDPKNREAVGRMREEQMDDMVKKFARGETPDFGAMFRGPGGGDRPRGERPEGQPGQPPPGGPGGEGRQRWEQMSQEERDKAMAERRARMDQRMAQAFNGGNSQNIGLRGEFFKRMRESGMGPGGPGGMRGPGGGNRPGGGGGGGGGAGGGGGSNGGGG